MASIQELEHALINADAAGDADAARTFAGEIARMRSAGAPSEAIEPQAVAPSQPAATDVQPKGTLQSIREAVHAPTRALVNGVFMGLGDRARAGIGALIGDGSYGSNLADEQKQSDQFSAAHPVVAPVLEGVGGVATPIGAIGAASKATSLGGKFLLGAGAGAGIGGAQGALASRDYTNLPQVERDAVTGGVIGGALGGSIPLAGRAIGAGYQAVANAMLNRPEGISRGAGRHLIDAVNAETPSAVQARLAELGPDATLADAGPALLGKAQGASLNSDEGRSILQTALTGRDQGTNARIMGDVNRALGPAEDPQMVSDAIKAHRSSVDSVAYPQAVGNAPDVETDAILKTLDGLIPQSVGMERKALQSTRDMLSVPAERPAQAPAVIPPSGTAASSAATVAHQEPTPAVKSLVEFIASKGGLQPHPELEAIGLARGHRAQVPGSRGFFGVVKPNGAHIDRMREAAEEAGYLRGQNGGTSTPTEFLDAIDAELRGQKRYPEGSELHRNRRENVAMSEREQHEYDSYLRGFEDDLDAAGHGGLVPDVKQRAINLMAKDGMDADSAVEHAFLQLDQEESASRQIGGFPGDQPTAPAPKTEAQRNALVLHKIKQELDNVIQYDAPGLGVPAGALQRQQAALKMIRAKLNNALESQVPGYREANAASSSLAKRAEAVEAGMQYLGSGKTTPFPERFAAEFDPLSQGEKIAFAKGSRGNIERILGTKANDLQALRSELQGEGGFNTAKIATVHGQDAADQLIGSVERNLKFRDTYNKVVENSQTAQRQAAAAALKPVPPGDVPLINPNMSATGFALAGAKKVLSAIANGVRPDPTRSYGELAKVLSAQGSERDKHLQEIVETIMRRERTSAKAPIAGDSAALIAAIIGNSYLQHSQPRTR